MLIFKVLQSNKIIIAMFTAIFLVGICLSPTSSHSANHFSDVPDWAEDAVTYLVENEAVQGYSNGTFRPYEGLTRAQAAKILAVSLHLQIDEGATSVFSDVGGHWAEKYIAAIQNERKDVIKGYPDGTFRPNASITRAQLTKMIVEAYHLKQDTDAYIYFSDVPDWAASYIYTLGSLGIVEGTIQGKFQPSNHVTRVQMAAIIHRTEVIEARLIVPQKQLLPSIEEVKVFNETKFEITFSSALEETIAHEIEHSGKRFAVYPQEQSIHSEEAIQSQTISFNDNYTRASVILAEDRVKTDAYYTVALLDADYRDVAEVVTDYTSVLLKQGTEQPTVYIDGKQDKLILKFHEKMSDLALEASHYQIYENNQLRGSLAEYIAPLNSRESREGIWEDSTEKTAVEFRLTKKTSGKKFKLGEMYKIVVSNNVITEKGAELSEVERTIRIQIPSLLEAAPQASIIRIVNGEFIITFDKYIMEGMLNSQLITVKKPNGHELPVADVEVGSIDDTISQKELKIIIAEGYQLDSNLTYIIDLPENLVANQLFPNAVNQKITGLTAKAQKDLEVMEVSANLVRQAADKSKANLQLTFDQRVDLDSLKNLHHDAIMIQDNGIQYQLIDGKFLSLDDGDTSGKTIVIQDIEKAFSVNGRESDQGFKLRSKKLYKVKLKAKTIKTENGHKVNLENLSSYFLGIGIAAPELDQIVLSSSEEMIVSFKEEIDAKKLQAHHIKVQGYEQYNSGNFTENPVLLTGNSQLKFRVDGKKIIITPANRQVKFVTGTSERLLVIQGDVIKGKDSGIANTKLTSADWTNPAFIIDRAAPIMIGAKKEDHRTLIVTYSESIQFKGESPELQATQYSVEHATKNAYGMDITPLTNERGDTPVVRIKFNKPNTFQADLNWEKVKLIYMKNNNGFVTDLMGYEQKNYEVLQQFKEF